MKYESSLSAHARKNLLWALPVLLVVWIVAGNYIGKFIQKSIEEQNGWRELPVYFSDNGGWVLVGIDKYDRIWARSFSSGVGMIDGEKMTIYNTNNSGIVDNSVRSMALDPAGNLWIRTPEGLSFFDGEDWRTYSISNSGIDDDDNLRYESMAVDQDGRVWIGTYDGVSVFNGVEWATYTTGNSGLIDNRVGSIAFDQDGKAWIVADDNISVFDGESWINYTPRNSGLPEEPGLRIGSIVFDQAGRAWIEAYIVPRDGGVYVFNGRNWTVYTAKNSALIGDIVHDMVVDHEGKVWIATRDGGVSLWDGDHWITYTDKNSPLPVNSVRYLEVFSNGEILIDTNLGPAMIFSNDGQLPASPFLVTLNEILSDHVFGSFLIISPWLVIVFGCFSHRIALSKRYFLPLWILATTLAWCIFIPIYWEFADRTGGGGELGFYSGGSLIQLLLLYVKIGLVIGVCQWVVLQLYIPEAGWWILATAGGCFLGIVISRVFGVDDGVIHLLFIYSAVGVFQWLFLRKFSSADGLDALIWVILKPLGLGAAMIVMLIALLSFNAEDSFGSPLAALPMGIAFGLISGLRLAATLRRQRK